MRFEFIFIDRSCLKRQLFTSDNQLVHKFIFSYSADRGQEDNSARANARGETNEKRKKLSTYTKAERLDLEQKKTTKNDPFQTTTSLYAFQIRRRASVTPTSFVSNSYRPTAVVRVKARRSQLHRE